MVQQTYIMLKPDALQRGLVGEILARIERKGYRFVRCELRMLDEDILREHYAHIADKPFFPEIVTYMTSGPVLAMIVEGDNAVKGMRIIMGVIMGVGMIVLVVMGMGMCHTVFMCVLMGMGSKMIGMNMHRKTSCIFRICGYSSAYSITGMVTYVKVFISFKISPLPGCPRKKSVV